ncbi:hypothetical protein [Ottowia sp. SB7-C50]|uniref:hypothetical protein n=1 Tax=Ottowia sp. SB7-C50 TaxID=3081231 RepID=UPI0029557BFE|nr:hypothetical protein [Ottowia sp. SB7-C50]WOP14658.1 hypothetical protein R0D99_12485 [Ottowia sp. SB7-C50]
MSLASRINDGFAAVRNKLNLMVPRLLPAGGSAGQVLTKSSAADYAAGWATPASGSGGTSTSRNVDGGSATPEPRSGSVNGGTA